DVGKGFRVGQVERMDRDFHFRWASADDYDLLGQIMFDAVRNGESRYSEAQRAAWAPAPRSGPEWAARLESQEIVLADRDGEAVGFVSLAAGGYVDFAYIRPEAQHSALFRRLVARIAERAAAKGEPLLWTHASLTAEAAFERLGFTVRRRERVELGGESFERCEMEMPLARGGPSPRLWG
ncbi:MAG TPA: GNAT family N-acetyltransferase, partial [Allosphingosinicella sp.]